MRKQPRYFRVSITVTHELMEVLFDLLKNEDAQDFRMMELGPDGQAVRPPMAASQSIVNPVHPGERPRRTYERGTKWVEKHWPDLKPVFQNLNGASINYKDMRLVEAVVKSGMSPSSVSTMMSALAKHGLIVRTHLGEYKLA